MRHEDGAGRQTIRRTGRFDRNADPVGVQFPLENGALHVLDAEIQDVGDGVFRAVDPDVRASAQRGAEFGIQLLHMGGALRQLVHGQLQRRGEGRGQRDGGGAAAVDGGALAAVDERFQRQIPPFEQQADAVQAVEFVGRQAHGVHPFERDGDLAHGLCGVHMQVAVGVILQDLGDFVHRLHDAEFTVHKGDGHGDGVRAEQIFQMLQINGAVPLDVYKVDLAALLLQSGQRAADGGVLQRSGDDVLAHMAGEPHQPFERKVVGLAGAGSIDDLGGLNAQQRGDFHRGGVDLCLGGCPCLMVGVRVADAAALHRTKPVEHAGVGRGIG